MPHAQNSALPPEILEKILVLAVRGDSFSEQLFKSSSDDVGEGPSWSDHVQMTLVCTMWRLTALGCAEFWASIPFLHLTESPRFPEMVERSRSSPLTLKLGRLCRRAPILRSGEGSQWCWHPKSSATQLALVFDPSRIRGIVLHGDTALRSEYIAAFPRAKTPNLETLIISAPAPSPNDRMSNIILQRNPRLPKHCLTASRPALRILKLQQCAAPWSELRIPSSPLFPHLISLYLASLQPRLPVGAMRALLHSCPVLEEIHLSSALAGPTPLPADRSLTCSLPRLTSIVIQDEHDGTRSNSEDVDAIHWLYSVLLAKTESSVVEHIRIRPPKYNSRRGPLRLPEASVNAPRPALRSLHIAHCFIPWTHVPIQPLFPYLSCLSLDSLRPGVPMDVLLPILASSPSLTELMLQHAFTAPDPQTAGISPSSAFSVFLPQLRLLSIADQITSVQSLYSALVHPASTKVTFFVTDEGGQAVEQSPSLFEICGITIRSKNQRRAHTMFLKDAQANLSYFELHDTVETSCKPRYGSKRELFRHSSTLPTTGSAEDNQTPALTIAGAWDFRAVLSMLRVRGIQHIGVDIGNIEYRVTAESWRAFFGRHEETTTLSVHGDKIGLMLTAVIDRPGHPQSNDNARTGGDAGNYLPLESVQLLDAGGSSARNTGSGSATSVVLPSLRKLEVTAKCNGDRMRFSRTTKEYESSRSCDAYDGVMTLLDSRTGRSAIDNIELRCNCRSNELRVEDIRAKASLGGGLTTVSMVAG